MNIEYIDKSLYPPTISQLSEEVKPHTPIFRLPQRQEYINNPNQQSTYLGYIISHPISLLFLLYFLYKIYHLLFVPISEDGTGYDSKSSELKAGLYELFALIFNLISIPILMFLCCMTFLIHSGLSSSNGGNYKTNEYGFKNFNIQTIMVFIVPMVVIIIFLYKINIYYLL
jgi:hypothetical protein